MNVLLADKLSKYIYLSKKDKVRPSSHKYSCSFGEKSVVARGKVQMQVIRGVGRHVDTECQGSRVELNTLHKYEEKCNIANWKTNLNE